MPKVSIILVHYRVKKVLFDCIRSIYSSKPKTSIEIIAVDNDEVKSIKNELKKMFPKVKYVPAPCDLGYGKGNNLGAEYAKGEYILILNPDTIVTKGTIDKLVKFIESEKNIGIVAPTLSDGKGKVYELQGTAELTPARGIFGLSFLNKIFPGNPVSKEYWLKDINRDAPYEVDVVPGSAFLIKRKIFEKVGGFDKNFFLYFEESDLCKRVKEIDYKIFILPGAEVIHFWAVSTPKSGELNRIFAESRFYYFKKHFGILNALLVELFAQLNKKIILLLLIIALGTFLRFYRLIPNLILNGEMGTDYMNVWNMLHGARTWLIGPRTSHEWFFIPPFSYWVYSVLFFFGKYNPVIINLFWAFAGSFAVLIGYHYTKKLFDEKIALITAFLVAVSPSFIDYTRASRYNAPVAYLFFPYLYYLKKSIEDNGKSLGVLGFILGLSLNFFPSLPLLLPAVIVSFLIYRIRPMNKYILNFILWLILPNITFFIYEVSDKFKIIRDISLWIPYRVAGFFGVYHKNTVNPEILKQNIYSVYHFFAMPLPVFLLLIAGCLFLFIRSLKNKDKETAFILLIINLVVGYLGLFIHGNPPEHYYLVIFPVPLMLLAYFLVKTFKNIFVVSALTLSVGILFIWIVVKQNWFYSGYFPSYRIQQKVAGEILADAGGKEFSLTRFGTNDQFENNFANNYIYLLTIRGAKIANDANLRYTIVEGGSSIELFRNDEVLDPEIK